MGENNTLTALKACGVKMGHKSSLILSQTINIAIIDSQFSHYSLLQLVMVSQLDLVGQLTIKHVLTSDHNISANTDTETPGLPTIP